MSSITPHYELVEHRLDNGLRLVVNPDPVSPAVAVNIWYQVGSRDEVAGRTGFAHLFEHLMFQGSAQVASGEHLAAIQAVGGTVNATTSFDRTNYFETVPPHALDLALWLEAERMASLAVTQENLDNQRDVVLEEKRQRYDNTPYGDLLELLLATNFPEGHPYAHPTIGSMPDLLAAPLEWVREFHAQWYQPSDAVLVISGAVGADEAIERVTRYFGELPSAPPPGRRPVPRLPPPRDRRLASVTRDVPRTVVALGWLTPDMTTPAADAVDQTLAVLGNGQASRLHERLVRRDELAESVSASALSLAQGNSLSFISAALVPGADPAEVEQRICEEVERLIADGPEEREVERVGAQFEREWLSELAGVDDRADRINEAASVLGDPTRVNSHLQVVQSITADDITAAARDHLQVDARSRLHYLSEATR